MIGRAKDPNGPNSHAPVVHRAGRKSKVRGNSAGRTVRQLVVVLGDPKHRGNRLRALSIGSVGTPKRPLTASEANLSAIGFTRSIGRLAQMKATGFLVGSALFLAACSQAINYTCSKKNFRSPTIEAACKHQKSPVMSCQQVPREQQSPLDDATVA